MKNKRFILNLILATVVMWVVLVLLLFHHLSFIGVVFVAFLLGLRHGFDVDHILVINNVSRQLVEEGKSSTCAGFFFALGHSSIVFILTLTIIFGLSFTQNQRLAFLHIGSIVGTVVSIMFLWLSASLNLISLYRVIKQNKAPHIHSVFSRYLTPIFRLVDRSYKMYFVGVLFGLGFDTATEVAVLGLGATAFLKGLSVWSVLCLPLFFALGMTWVDTLSALVMTTIFNQENQSSCLHRRLNTGLLSTMIVSAFTIGFIELYGLLRVHFKSQEDFLSIHSAVLGGAIFLVFLIMLSFRRRNRSV